jgi:hypothetical protein
MLFVCVKNEFSQIAIKLPASALKLKKVINGGPVPADIK